MLCDGLYVTGTTLVFTCYVLGAGCYVFGVMRSMSGVGCQVPGVRRYVLSGGIC